MTDPILIPCTTLRGLVEAVTPAGTLGAMEWAAVEQERAQ